MIIAVVVLTITEGQVVGRTSRIPQVIARRRVLDDTGMLEGIVIVTVGTEAVAAHAVAVPIEIDADSGRNARIGSGVTGITFGGIGRSRIHEGCLSGIGSWGPRKNKRGRSRPRATAQKE